mmetsp:Transcript_120412/g.275833  ORF Transcript_120412/g.275833 Transcript_120412/m.275833 type:complete len:495 (+) Transcript_120412:26-1510(+)
MGSSPSRSRGRGQRDQASGVKLPAAVVSPVPEQLAEIQLGGFGNDNNFLHVGSSITSPIPATADSDEYCFSPQLLSEGSLRRGVLSSDMLEVPQRPVAQCRDASPLKEPVDDHSADLCRDQCTPGLSVEGCSTTTTGQNMLVPLCDNGFVSIELTGAVLEDSSQDRHEQSGESDPVAAPLPDSAVLVPVSVSLPPVVVASDVCVDTTTLTALPTESMEGLEARVLPPPETEGVLPITYETAPPDSLQHLDAGLGQQSSPGFSPNSNSGLGDPAFSYVPRACSDSRSVADEEADLFPSLSQCNDRRGGAGSHAADVSRLAAPPPRVGVMSMSSKDDSWCDSMPSSLPSSVPSSSGGLCARQPGRAVEKALGPEWGSQDASSSEKAASQNTGESPPTTQSSCDPQSVAAVKVVLANPDHPQYASFAEVCDIPAGLSLGSLAHGSGDCNPCHYFFKNKLPGGNCQHGRLCGFCHVDCADHRACVPKRGAKKVARRRP